MRKLTKRNIYYEGSVFMSEKIYIYFGNRRRRRSIISNIQICILVLLILKHVFFQVILFKLIKRKNNRELMIL